MSNSGHANRAYPSKKACNSIQHNNVVNKCNININNLLIMDIPSTYRKAQIRNLKKKIG